MIDSRDFIAAKRRAEAQVLLPAGARIAFTGGTDYNDHRAIWAAIDRARAKRADMVLLHGAGPNGAELIAAKWADARNIIQIAFKPDWDRHKRAAPFKHNDAMLDTLPIGAVVLPAPTSPITSPARRRSSASRCSTSARRERERPAPRSLTRRTARGRRSADRADRSTCATKRHWFPGTSRPTPPPVVSPRGPPALELPCPPSVLARWSPGS